MPVFHRLTGTRVGAFLAATVSTLVLGLTLAAPASANDVWLQNYFGPTSIPRDTGTVSYSVLVNNNSGIVMVSNTILIKAEAVQKNPDADVKITMCGNETVNEGSCLLSSNLTAGASWNFGVITLEAPGNIFPTSVDVKFSVSRAGDLNPLNDSLSVIVPFQKSATDLATGLDPASRTVDVGDTVPYTLTTTGEGEDTAAVTATVEAPAGVEIDDISDPDCSVVSGENDLTCDLGSTPARTINFDATFEEPGSEATLTSEIGSDSNTDPVPANDQATSVVTVNKARPSLSPGGATSVDLGETITSGATLSGGVAPSGEITFTAYGPDDETCSGDPAFVSAPVAVTGPGLYSSPAFTPAVAGSYRWTSSYSGDGKNEPASSGCGDPGSVSTVSTVPDPTPPACPAVKLDFSINTFKANRKGVNRQVAGLRILMATGTDVEADITPRYLYRIKGKTRSAKLDTRTVRVNGQKRMLFGVPRQMSRQLRRNYGRVTRNMVTFEIGAILRFQGASTECGQDAGTKRLKTRISGVNIKRALTRSPSF